jgi:hypothetical protein
MATTHPPLERALATEMLKTAYHEATVCLDEGGKRMIRQCTPKRTLFAVPVVVVTTPTASW